MKPVLSNKEYHNMTNCELCEFNNPKCTATAVIIRDNRLLMLKRAEDPYKGMWDLPGGYLNEGERPEQALAREIKEELEIGGVMQLIDVFPGTAQWKEKKSAVMSFAYLFFDREGSDIILNLKENSEYAWMSLKDINPNKIAFDSNQDIVHFVKEKFTFDLERVRELVGQLDNTTVVTEEKLYNAILNGFLSTRYKDEKLVGMGWIFPRQTMSRKQAVVEDMIVDDAYRGQGLGRELLDDLVKWAAKEGIEMIELTSSPKRVAANALYKKHGFQLHPTNHYLYNVNAS